MTETRVYLVGAGPGDPGLITVKAAELLKRADVVLYDYLASDRFLEWLRPDCEKIYVGKKAGQHALPQDDLNDLIVEKARQGKTVVRLKGGDPFVFGRGGEEALRLAESGVPFEIVPGISAGAAVPAYAGIPVTHRGIASSVAFITGHEAPDKDESAIDWPRIAGAADTLVFFMGVRNLPLIVENLIANGRSAQTPAALIQWGTRPSQKTAAATLDTIVDEVARVGIKPPALIVVGDVVALREKIGWFESRPLFGRSVLVTRSRHQASKLSERLLELGAEAIEYPTIRIEPPENFSELDDAIESIHDYDWIIFTSTNGVDAFFDRFFAEGRDIRDLGSARFAAIGPATARRISDLRLRVDFQASRFISEQFVVEFIERYDCKDRRFLLPGSDKARDVIEKAIVDAGGDFNFVTAYRTLPVEPGDQTLADIMAKATPDWVTFTSSTTAQNFFSAWDGQGEFRIASIGPITSETVRQAGREPDIEAKEHTIEGLIQALLDFERQNK
ncbi:MAG: uroporphyrinogen-III C-methyltransferase [bacterium]